MGTEETVQSLPSAGEDRGGASLRFLGDVSMLLAGTRNLVDTLGQIARRCLGDLGDACYFDLLDERGFISRVAWAHVDAAKQAEYDALWPRVKPQPYAGHPAAVMVANGESVYIPDFDDAWMKRMASSEDHLAYMRREHPYSLLVIPLNVDATPFGAITLSRTELPKRPHSNQELAIATELGRRVAFAVAYARQQATLRRLNADLEAEVLRRTHERERIWNVTGDLMSVAGTDGYLKAVNPAWSKVLGYDEATLLSTPYREFAGPDPDGSGDVVLARLAHGETVLHYEGRLRHRDGSWRWFSWTVVPEGNLHYAIGRDITEERQRNRELEEANRKLREQIEERERMEATVRQMQRMEAIGQLTAGVAHDFNNLLTVIAGNIALMERELGDNERAARRMANMRAAADRAATLTAQLLAFARRQKLAPALVDVGRSLEEMRQLLETTLGSGVAVAIELHDEPLLVDADPTQLELVVLNLAINARDAMDGRGRLCIEAQRRRLGASAQVHAPSPGEYVCITVSDTGSGISPEIVERVFEPFFTTKEIGRGSGLGLSQALGFAKQSGGGIELETAPGKGTRVSICLPAVAARTTTAQVTQAELKPNSGRGRKILVVDDDEAVRDVTAEMLEGLGYEVIGAPNAATALEQFAAHRDIAAVLVDFAMPAMNGVELAGKLRAKAPALPVLFITGYAGASALRASDDAVLQKPFDEGRLGRQLAALLRDGE